MIYLATAAHSDMATARPTAVPAAAPRYNCERTQTGQRKPDPLAAPLLGSHIIVIPITRRLVRRAVGAGACRIRLEPR